MQFKKIFLASSKELEEDRRAFELMLGRLNQRWRQRDVTFDVVLWENFIDEMKPKGLQDAYNKAASECDLFVMMFFTKVGRFTLEEFETVFARRREGEGPRIYTYFRDDYIRTGEVDDSIKTLLDFKARLRELKHYVTTYRNTEDLLFQFSSQLELLYGDGGAQALDIDDRTSPVKVGEIALVLSYRHLFGAAPADPARMAAAIERATRPVRDTLYQMASAMRRENWLTDKRLMERTIPVLEALTRADATWHAPWGQLGYALVDKVPPDWQRAKECLDRAVALRGDDLGEGRYYDFNRARCAVHLDPSFAARQKADAGMRETVIDVLKDARRELGNDWEQALKWPDAEALRDWLALNGSPRLR